MTTATMKKITVDGIDVEVTDIAASVVERTIRGLQAQIDKLTEAQKKDAEEKAAANKAKDELTVQLKTTTDAKDAEIVALKKQLEDAKLSPSQIDQLVKDRAETVSKAKAVLGDKLVVDGKTISDIQRQVVDAKLGDGAKGWNETQVASAFAAFTADVKSSDVLADALTNSRPGNGVDIRDKAYNDRNARLTGAWKGSSPAAGQQH